MTKLKLLQLLEVDNSIRFLSIRFIELSFNLHSNRSVKIFSQ